MSAFQKLTPLTVIAMFINCALADFVIENPVVPGARFTQLHGDYPSPKGNTHIGVDLAAPCGTKVLSFADGYVENLIQKNKYKDCDTENGSDGIDYCDVGNAVVIKHADDLYTTYLHLQDSPQVVQYQKVTRGEEIGRVGTTGESTGCHLHFEAKNSSELGFRGNIYAKGKVELSFYRGLYDPIELFCTYPDGIPAPLKGKPLSFDLSRSGCPDLSFHNLLASNPPVKVKPKNVTYGDPIKFELSIFNRGRGSAKKSTLRVRLASAGEAVRSSQPLLYSTEIGELRYGGFAEVSELINLPPGLSSGNYDIVFVLDADRTAGQHPRFEADDTVRATISLEARNPDLVVTNAPYMFYCKGPCNPGSPGKVTIDILNAGNKQSEDFEVRVRINSSNSNVTPSDALLTSIKSSQIAPQGRIKIQREVKIPESVAPGVNYVWVILDVESTAGQTKKGEENDRAAKAVTIYQKVH